MQLKEGDSMKGKNENLFLSSKVSCTYMLTMPASSTVTRMGPGRTIFPTNAIGFFSVHTGKSICGSSSLRTCQYHTLKVVFHSSIGI
ncbi:hypothetical protein L1049_001933 [Liquidambar formosana]|uniref:Uncharacterized protein n=1 Tax=Liquidambar formosana TaxID=63359 RepID=A0AAP0R690_LIQFO